MKWNTRMRRHGRPGIFTDVQVGLLYNYRRCVSGLLNGFFCWLGCWQRWCGNARKRGRDAGCCLQRSLIPSHVLPRRRESQLPPCAVIAFPCNSSACTLRQRADWGLICCPRPRADINGRICYNNWHAWGGRTGNGLPWLGVCYLRASCAGSKRQ